MDSLELIESAAKKVGGISELARQLDWNKGSIAAIKAGKTTLPAYRAAQMARLLGRDEASAYLGALAAQAKGEEKAFWLAELKKRSKSVAIIAALAILLNFSTLPRADAAQLVVSLGTTPDIHYSHKQARDTLLPILDSPPSALSGNVAGKPLGGLYVA